MEILEREGKFYLILANGELELTEEQVKSRLQKGAIIRNNLQSWIDNFQYKHWLVNSISANPEVFIKSDAFFDDIIRELEQIYIAAYDKVGCGQQMIDFCKKQVERLIRDKERATLDKDKTFINYHMLCWFRVITYLQALTHTYKDIFPG
ncbi:MAG: hypothetical protein ACTHJ0_05585 [Flavipsychrobacter sp.]